MQVILTPTVVPNKFGPGLNGFTNSTPLATQLSAEWFDSVQQEIVNVIIGQGIALDGFQLDQLKQAIDDYSFNSPTITGSLTIDAGGFLEIDGVANVNSAGGFVLKMGSTFAVESGVTFIWANNTVVVGTDNTNDWTINGNVTLGTDDSSAVSLRGDVTLGFDASSNATLNGALNGAVGSSVVAPTISPLILAFQSSGTTLPTVAGNVRWNDTFFSVRDGAGQIHTISEPRRGFDLVFTTSAAMADTTAETGRRIKENEDVWIDMGSHIQVNAASQDVAYQVRVTGPLGSADIFTGGVRSPTVANTGAIVKEAFRWRPTDSFAEVATQNYTFRVRMGVSGGGANTLTADRVHIVVQSAAQT